MERKWVFVPVAVIVGACFATMALAHGGLRDGRGDRRGPRGSGPAPGSLLESFDSNADGAISGEELSAGLAARQADLLEEVDEDGDGSISADELAAIDNRHAEMIARLDTDDDGDVSAEELAANVEKRKSEILERLDTNADGTISAEELAAYEPEGSDRPFSHGRPIEELDADGDGTVSGEELSAGLALRQAAWLKEVDTNGDGAISAEELAALDDRFASKVTDLDTDGDGSVSAGELAADLAARKAEILERLDANGNGNLEAEELAAAPRGCMDTDEEEAAADQVEAQALVLGTESEFLRGDVSADGLVDLSDATAVAGALYLGAAQPACEDAADSNDDGAVDLTDVIGILLTLFQGSQGIALPYPNRGVDPTVDSLSCEE